MLPLSTGCSPAMASSSSFWPQPEMPAMPRISPELAVKLTSSSLSVPSMSRTVRPLTSTRGFGSFGSGRSMFSTTGWPTIMLVISWALVVFVGMSPMNCPWRSTATRSLSASTSCILCVMMTMALPSLRMLRSTAKSLSVSCGVSTAVGSSRIRMSAPR